MKHPIAARACGFTLIEVVIDGLGQALDMAARARSDPSLPNSHQET